MQKINDLFGKRVISQASGNQIATVRDIVLDAEVRRIIGLVIGDGRAHDEQVARWPRVLGVGEYVVVDAASPLPAASDDPEIVELRKGAEQITGKKVISAGGEQIGTVENMYFDPDGTIIGFELKGGLFGGSDPQAIRAEDVQAVGRDAVIATTSEPIKMSELSGDAPAEVDEAEDRGLAHERGGDDFTRSEPLTNA